MLPKIIKFLEPLAIITILIIAFSFFSAWVKQVDKENYNNGYCTICGTELKMTKQKNYKHDTKWVYECPKCGRIIILNFNVADENN